MEYCPAGAVRLGQKLCKKDGTEVQYPKQELPDAVKWGPEKYDFNYRDNNRINTHETGTAPCKSACPAHIAVQGYIKMASQGRYKDALALIKKQNPFPAVCGAVCNRRCEDACTRGKIDEALSIDAIKRFIAKQDLNADTRYIPPVVIPASIHMDHFAEKIAIIGGGPAGLTAAFYLAQTGYRPTVFEKNEHPGGMLRYGIPSYKLEKDVLDAEIDVAKEMGVEIKTGIEVGKDVTIQQLREQGYQAFYIAIGCSAGSLPDIKNINSQGVMTAIDYLHESNCGNIPFDGKVVVVGGGNVAIDASRVSSRNKASQVQQFCLEQEVDMPASNEEIAEAREDGVTIHCGWGPQEIIETNGKVSAIVFKKCVSVFNDEGKFAPVYDENTKNGLVIDPGYKCDGILKAAQDDGVNIKYVLITHCHYDHISDMEQLREKTGAKLVSGDKASINITDPDINLSYSGLGYELSAKKSDIVLKDNEELNICLLYTSPSPRD